MGAEDAGKRAPGKPRRKRSQELRRLVSEWRTRLKPEQIPGLFASFPWLRGKAHLSQDDVARLVGVSDSWYGDLERGRVGGWSPDFLDRVVYQLRLSDAERRVLYFHALGREPAAAHVPSTVVSDAYKALVDAQPWPAYISDVAWDVLYHNEHVADWFPWLPYTANVMRWVFTFPEARLQLANWEQQWAPPMVAQMAFVAAQVNNDRLNTLIKEIKEQNEAARRMFEQHTMVKPHPDGDLRTMYVPYRPDPIPVRILASAPLHELTQRIIWLRPESADANPGIVIPRPAGGTGERDRVYPAGPARRRMPPADTEPTVD